MNSEISLFALIACVFGAGLADLDEPRSKFGRKAGLLSKILKKLFKHRGVMHSAFGAVVVYFIAYFLLSLIGFSDLTKWLLIGYLSHLVTDSITPQGVAWLSPLSKKRLRGGLKTGKLGEKVFLFLIIIAIVLLASKIFQPFYL